MPGCVNSRNEPWRIERAWHVSGIEIIQNWFCLENTQKLEKCWNPITEGLVGRPKNVDFIFSTVGVTRGFSAKQ